MRSKSPTNKKLCAGGCGVKILKAGPPTCSSGECMESFISSDAISKAMKKVRQQKEAQLRKDKRKRKAELTKRKKALYTMNDLKRICQGHVNKYIRERDKGKPCISCGRPWREGDVDAGHFIPRGKSGASTAVRFDYRNINGQCKECNRFGFSPGAYREEHHARYGDGVLEAMEQVYNESVVNNFKPTREWIEDIQSRATADLKAIKTINSHQTGKGI